MRYEFNSWETQAYLIMYFLTYLLAKNEPKQPKTSQNKPRGELKRAKKRPKTSQKEPKQSKASQKES